MLRRNASGRFLWHVQIFNAHPCKFTIFSDRVETENANNPRGKGKIDPTNFSPYPKNPTIAKFFIQLGRAEELGSGVLNVSHYVKEYSGGGEASFIEGDIFRTIVPITKTVAINGATNSDNIANDAINDAINDAVENGLIDSLSDAVKNGVIDTMKVIYTTKGGVRTKDIVSKINKSSSSVDRYLDILRKINLITFEGGTKSGKYLVKKDSALSQNQNFD